MRFVYFKILQALFVWIKKNSLNRSTMQRTLEAGQYTWLGRKRVRHWSKQQHTVNVLI